MIAQKTVMHTPLDKVYDAVITLRAGAHGLVEINTRLRSDPVLQAAFGRTGCEDGLDDAGRAQAGAGDVEEDEVGLDPLHVDGEARNLGQPLGEAAGVGVVLAEALDVVAQGVDPAGRDDPGLAHRAAEGLLVAPGLLDEGAGAGQRRADRRAQALGEVDPGRIEPPGEVGRLDPGGDDRVHQAGAVHVDRKTPAMGDVADLAHRRQRPDRAAAGVAGVLDRDEARRRRVAGVRADRRLDLGAGEDAVRPDEGRQDHAGEHPRRAAFRGEGMRGAIEQDLVAGAGVDLDRDLVAHRPRREIQRRLHPEQAGDHLLEEVDRRVLPALLVPDLGGAHVRAHLRGRSGLGIAVQVNLDLGHRRPRFRL